MTAKHIRHEIKTVVNGEDGAEKEQFWKTYEDFTATGQLIEQSFTLASSVLVLTQAGPSFKPRSIAWRADEAVNLRLCLRTYDPPPANPSDAYGINVNGVYYRLVELTIISGGLFGVVSKNYARCGLIPFDYFDTPGVQAYGECLKYIVTRKVGTLPCKIDIAWGA